MSLQVKYHVVPDNFQIREDGILGNDFLGRYSAIINYKTGQVECNGSKLKIKIRDSIVIQSFISARSILTYYIKISNPEIKTALSPSGEDIYGGAL